MTFFLSKEKKHKMLWATLLPCLFVLVFFLKPAHAQVIGGIVTDPVTETETTATVAETSLIASEDQAELVLQTHEAAVQDLTWIQQVVEWIDHHLEVAKKELQDRIEGEKQKAIANGNTNAIIDNARAVAGAQEAARHTAAATQPDTSTTCVMTSLHQNENVEDNITKNVDHVQLAYYLKQGSNAQGAQTSKAVQDMIWLCKKIGTQFTFIDAPLANVQATYGGNCQAGTLTP